MVGSSGGAARPVLLGRSSAGGVMKVVAGEERLDMRRRRLGAGSTCLMAMAQREMSRKERLELERRRAPERGGEARSLGLRWMTCRLGLPESPVVEGTRS